METLLDPNLIYLLVAAGLIVAVLALAVPGTGLLEAGALGVLGLAGLAIFLSEQTLSIWALLMIVLGLGLFFASLRRGRRAGGRLLLALAILAIIFGSAYIFQSPDGWRPAVHPLLAAAVSVPWGAFFWFVGRKVIESERQRPRHDLLQLLNEVGEAKTPIHKDGSVQVDGELWSAYSDQPIQPGQRVQVVDRKGFTLKVEALPQKES